MPMMNLMRVCDYANPDGASTVLNTANGRYMSGDWVENGFQLIRILPTDYKPKPHKIWDPKDILRTEFGI